MKRFRVAGHSMTPTLQPGQEVVAVSTRDAEPGNLVVFEHPARSGLWLIKRLADESGWVVSDNEEHAHTDSRTLGPIPTDSLHTVVERLDEHSFALGAELLTAEDEYLAALVDRWGLPEFWHRPPGFQTLVLLVLEQQVSLESGAAMYRRLAGLVGEVTAPTILSTGEDGLRSIGVTRQKSSYLLGLAEQVADGVLDMDELERASVDDARATLLAIKGIGPWTADAYLLSASRRPDMWPVGDRALQVGTGEALGMASVPDEGQLELIAEPWRPIRAVAARLIWHAYLSERGRVEPPNPTLVHEISPGA
ncbi:MAG TPA: S26 family signal peptidase [Acidimicrobiia bacterium]|nr:S26 family signal peptidase [Acidimicrobiia bacterium]